MADNASPAFIEARQEFSRRRRFPQEQQDPFATPENLSGALSENAQQASCKLIISPCGYLSVFNRFQRVRIPGVLCFHHVHEAPCWLRMSMFVLACSRLFSMKYCFERVLRSCVSWVKSTLSCCHSYGSQGKFSEIQVRYLVVEM